MNSKKIAAEKAVEYVHDGMTVGLGTGSTVYWAIHEIGEKIQQGLNIHAVATSSATEKLAKELEIPLTDFSKLNTIDLTIDGADEIDKEKNLIKGGGGALLREKIVAFNSKQFVVIADESKLVDRLGKFPLPVEVAPFGLEPTLKQVLKLCSKAELRKLNGKNYLTDNGNYIIDCYFKMIEDPKDLNIQLKQIPGVLETGIFLNTMVHVVIIGYENGTVKLINDNF
jgi:ribose 5-phosphate isomerase A